MRSKQQKRAAIIVLSFFTPAELTRLETLARSLPGEKGGTDGKASTPTLRRSKVAWLDDLGDERRAGGGTVVDRVVVAGAGTGTTLSEQPRQ